MRVQRGFDVAKNLVIDALSARRREHGIAKTRYVVEELLPRSAAQRVQVRHHRVRQQQAVAERDLGIAEHRPSGRHACDHARQLPPAREINLSMDRGGHRRRAKGLPVIY